MAPGGTKIVIRPRRGRGAQATRQREEEEDGDEEMKTDEQDGETGSSRSTSESTHTSAEEEEQVDIDNDDDTDPAVQPDTLYTDGDDAAEDYEPTPYRKRGRPRGRPRGSGTSTPRGRGRGRGRGRPRGRGITIKLPKRSGEEGQDSEATEGAEASTPAQEGEEGPIGGGKPFHRIQGKVYVIDGDEYVTDDDPKGDTKIDSNGNLLGERRFKSQTFILPNRNPERKYMLAIDAARTSGFRDSLYYFRRNPLAMKLNATQYEKDYLISVGKLGSHLKTRSVTMITARSAYKLHGAKMLAEGRWVIDDYYEDKALEEATTKGVKPGDLVGDLQDSSNLTNEAAALAAAAGGGGQGGKSERSGGGVGMYRAGGPTTLFGGSGWGPYSDGPLNAVRKSYLTREGVNEENWMWVAADRTVEMTREWAKLRGQALEVCGGILGDALGEPEARGEKRTAEEMIEDERKRKARVRQLPMGVYEPQTDIVLYRSDTQPTQSRWEALPDGPEKRRVLGGAKVGGGAWGVAWVDTVMTTPQQQQEDRWAKEREKYMDLIDLPPS